MKNMSFRARKLIKVTKNISNENVIILLTFNAITKKRNFVYLESLKEKIFLAKYVNII